MIIYMWVYDKCGSEYFRSYIGETEVPTDLGKKVGKKVCRDLQPVNCSEEPCAPLCIK
jgi:hypothetical protein